MPASKYAGVTQGLGQVAQHIREQPLRDARMAEARNRQKQSEIQLQEYIGNTENRQTTKDLEVAKMKNELFQLQTESLKNATFSAFRSYNADQDPRHLNTFLQRAKGKPGGEMWSNWNRFDQLSDTPNVRTKLSQAGYDGEASDAIIAGSTNKEMPAFVMATDTQGNQLLLDVDKMQQATGYSRYMEQQELADAQTRAKINQVARGTDSADRSAIRDLLADEKSRGNDMSFAEAAKMYFSLKNRTPQGSSLERETDRVMQENPGMSRQEAIGKAKQRTESRTSDVKNVEASNQKITELNDLNPDEGGDYFDLDLSDPKMRQRSGALISDYMQTRGLKLTSADKKVARQYRNLLDLGNTASVELTDEETGLMDNMFHGVKKYFSDNVPGTEGTTAYHSFRNVMRNALMGATLTKAELKAFDAAAGTLGQQLGPVLSALKTSMTDVRNNLQSMATDMDPYVAKHFLGRDVEQADQAIDAIDERIRHIVDLEERSARADNTSISDIKKQQKTVAPPVKVNIPSPITPDGAKPQKSIEEFWAERKVN